MKKLTVVGILLLTMLSASCEYGRQAEERLRELNTQAEKLDALVVEGIEKVTDLDSILPETSKKLKEADSIMNNASATLDSLNQKVKAIENIFK